MPSVAYSAHATAREPRTAGSEHAPAEHDAASHHDFVDYEPSSPTSAFISPSYDSDDEQFRYESPFQPPDVGPESSPHAIDHASSQDDRPSLPTDAEMRAQIQERERIRAGEVRSAVKSETQGRPWGVPSKLGGETAIRDSDRDLTLVTRWPSKKPYSLAENTVYAHTSAQNIEQSARDIADGKITTFSDLWDQARSSRLSLLNPTDDEDRTAFANARGRMTRTELGSHYTDINDDVERLRAGTPADEPRVFKSSYARADGTEGPALHGFSQRNHMGNHTLYNYQLDDDDMHRMLTNIHDEYAAALAAPDEKSALDHAFNAYRTTVAIAPDERGSASKAHYALQSVLLARGIHLPPAADGKAPDLEALVSEEAEWPARARQVFGLPS